MFAFEHSEDSGQQRIGQAAPVNLVCMYVRITYIVPELCSVAQQNSGSQQTSARCRGSPFAPSRDCIVLCLSLSSSVHTKVYRPIVWQLTNWWMRGRDRALRIRRRAMGPVGSDVRCLVARLWTKIPGDPRRNGRSLSPLQERQEREIHRLSRLPNSGRHCISTFNIALLSG